MISITPNLIIFYETLKLKVYQITQPLEGWFIILCGGKSLQIS